MAAGCGEGEGLPRASLRMFSRGAMRLWKLSLRRRKGRVKAWDAEPTHRRGGRWRPDRTLAGKGRATTHTWMSTFTYMNGWDRMVRPEPRST